MQTEALTLSLKLSTFEPPKVVEQKSKGWVTIGEKNLFFENLIKKKNNSVTQRSISKTITDLIHGDGFAYDEKQSALKQFLDKINPKGNANKVLRKVAKDAANCGGRAYQVIWAKDGKTIAEIYHQKFTTVRPGLMDEDGEVNTYWVCRDWSNTSKYKPIEMAAFDPAKAGTDPQQIAYFYEESDDVEYFPIPDYAAAEPYMELEHELAKMALGSVKKKMRLANIVWVKKNLDDEPEKRNKFREDFKKSFNGPDADEIMFVFDDASEMGFEVIPLTLQDNADNSLDLLDKIVSQKICTANRLTSPAIAALPGGNQLGTDGKEISTAFEYFMNTVVRPIQKDILEDFMLFLQYRKGALPDTTLLSRIKQLFSLNKKKDKNQPVLSIANTMPIQFTFSEQLLENILTDNELREAIGYDPIDNPEPTKPDPNALKTDPAGGEEE